MRGRRIVQESLANVLRHISKPGSNCASHGTRRRLGFHGGDALVARVSSYYGEPLSADTFSERLAMGMIR